MMKKRRGLIINMSSFSAVRPLPLISLYGATKSFVDYFTTAMSIECENSGVEVIVSNQKYFLSLKIILFENVFC